jgi:hypothetical protein
LGVNALDLRLQAVAGAALAAKDPATEIGSLSSSALPSVARTPAALEQFAPVRTVVMLAAEVDGIAHVSCILADLTRLNNATLV